MFTKGLVMESKTVLEKLSSAMSASNLQVKETASPIDYVIASGMVAQHQPEASKFITFNSTNSPSSYKEVRKAAIQIALRLNKKRNWQKDYVDIKRIADVAVKMYLVPRCPKCEGRKYQLMKDAPVLSATPCRKCNGTGNRAYPIKDEAHIRDVVQVILSIIDLAEKAIKRKTRGFY